MRGISRLLPILAVTATMTLAALAPADAKEHCAEGRTASGKCVDPHLARLLRHQTIVMTQPKLSHSAPPVMPGDGDVVPPPQDYFENQYLFTDQASIRGER